MKNVTTLTATINPSIKLCPIKRSMSLNNVINVVGHHFYHNRMRNLDMLSIRKLLILSYFSLCYSLHNFMYAISNVIQSMK